MNYSNLILRKKKKQTNKQKTNKQTNKNKELQSVT